ncbi:hypothetical protein NECAME_08344 [Necator americanus]|uniref:Uncharacterized protein n=1 Tax=Necator americanus TaxID=51031 RepID=W2TIP9_NECAM|nr:hypothetical protein NECAME_08344 [Necator americanus]ETN81678.1 hypothetical protein NECAME_08344 [Necator americanus]
MLAHEPCCFIFLALPNPYGMRAEESSLSFLRLGAIGDRKQASRCFRLALAADSEHGEAMVNLGILRQMEGKLDQARSLYHSAIAKSPHLFEPHFNLALLCTQKPTRLVECRSTMDSSCEGVLKINMNELH